MMLIQYKLQTIDSLHNFRRRHKIQVFIVYFSLIHYLFYDKTICTHREYIYVKKKIVIVSSTSKKCTKLRTKTMGTKKIPQLIGNNDNIHI